MDQINILVGLQKNCLDSKNRLCNENVPTLTIRNKEKFSNVPLGILDKQKKLLAQFKLLFQKDRLAVDEISLARSIIDGYVSDKKFAYLKLQEKVIYVNQRDNLATDGNGKIENRIKGGTCNVSSLAMTLKYMGLPTEKLVDFLKSKGFKKDTSKLQYEDLVEYVGQYGLKEQWDRYSHAQLGNLAKQLGFHSYALSGSAMIGKDWYFKKITTGIVKWCRGFHEDHWIYSKDTRNE